MTRYYQASAPGSLMLMGEHAVLWGTTCLVAAVDQRLTVVLKPRDDDNITITSTLFGTEQLSLSTLTQLSHGRLQNHQHQFVIATLIFYRFHLFAGFDLDFTSTIHDKKGFGSSAAVVAATQSVIHQFCQLDIPLIKRVEHGRTIIQAVQGRGSGADVAASIYGGIIAYQINPCTIEPIHCQLPLTVLFSGHKTPTSEVIDYVQHRINRHPDPHWRIRLIDRAQTWTDHAKAALSNNDMKTLGTAFENYAQLMIEWGVEDLACGQALQFLKTQPGITGAKISGAGLGDCVIGCGKPQHNLKLPKILSDKNMEIIDVALTDRGVSDESH